MQIVKEEHENCSLYISKSWFDKQKPCTQENSFFKFEDCELPYTLPVYADTQGMASKLFNNFLKSTEEHCLSLFDSPGMGKTSTGAFLSQLNDTLTKNTLYARFPADVGVLKTMKGCIGMALSNGPVEPSRLIKVVEVAALSTVDRILEILLETDFTPAVDMNFTIVKNGLPYLADDYEDQNLTNTAHRLQSLIATRAENLRSRVKKSTIVIHFDECQALSATNGVFLRVREDITIDRKDFEKYYIFHFCEALSSQANLGLKFVFSGTNVSIDRLLKFDSNVKFAKFPGFQWTTPETVLLILGQFLKMEKIPPNQKELLSQLCGVPRILRYFLLSACNTPKWNENSIETSIHEAFNDYTKKIDEAAVALQVAQESFNWIVYLFTFTDAIGATRENENSILLPYNLVPLRFVTWASSGIVRMESAQDGYRVFDPYPFLLSFLKKRITFVEGIDLHELFLQLRSGWHNPNFSKGFCFQFALAIELSLPSSPLLASILKSIDKDLLPFDHGTEPSPLEFFRSDKEAKKIVFVKNRVGLSLDGDNTQKKVGDIALPAKKNGNVVDVRIEVKHSEDDVYLRQGFQKFANGVEVLESDGHSHFFAFVCAGKVPSTDFFISPQPTKIKERRAARERKISVIKNEMEQIVVVGNILESDALLNLKFLSTPSRDFGAMQQIDAIFKRAKSISCPDIRERKRAKFSGEFFGEDTEVILLVRRQQSDFGSKVKLVVRSLRDMREQLQTQFEFSDTATLLYLDSDFNQYVCLPETLQELPEKSQILIVEHSK